MSSGIQALGYGMIAWGLLLAVSATVWLVVGVRMRRIEGSWPALDAATALPEPSSGWPFLSVIVPARNEELDVESCLASLRDQDYPNFELIFVDDESTDYTLERARTILGARSRCRVIAGRPRPDPQWVGKNWALVQGVAEASGDWLTFVDADVVHHPKTLRQAVALAFHMRVDTLSLMPAIACVSFWEKIIMPLFALLSALVEPLDRVNHPDKNSSRLSGAFILIRRPVYETAGGHRAISNQILEDMALGRRLKQSGCKLWLTYTHDLTRTRMFDSFHDLWLGLTRLSFPMMEYSLGYLGVSWMGALFACLTPWAAVGMGAVQIALGHVLHGAFCILAGAAICLAMTAVLKRVCVVLKVSRWYALWLPFGALVYCLAGTHSALRHYAGHGVGWKQRLYGTRA